MECPEKRALTNRDFFDHEFFYIDSASNTKHRYIPMHNLHAEKKIYLKINGQYYNTNLKSYPHYLLNTNYPIYGPMDPL
jgi:hypothetical protein